MGIKLNLSRAEAQAMLNIIYYQKSRLISYSGAFKGKKLKHLGAELNTLNRVYKKMKKGIQDSWESK